MSFGWGYLCVCVLWRMHAGRRGVGLLSLMQWFVNLDSGEVLKGRWIPLFPEKSRKICFYLDTQKLELSLGKLYLHNHLMNIGRRNFRRSQPQKKMMASAATEEKEGKMGQKKKRRS